jgi:hypothetical protein
MTLFDLPSSNRISTSQVRLALIYRKSSIMKIYKQFPLVVGEDFYNSAIAEIDSFLLYIDGSKQISVIKGEDPVATAIEFTISELQDKIEGLPVDGYFGRDKDELWYYFICNDQKVVEDKYETLDMMLDGQWRAISSIGTLNELSLVGQELRYLVLA